MGIPYKFKIMKVQLDTVNKTIKVEENINLDEFITKVKLLLGKDYKSFTLQTGTITYWYNPITWTPYNPYYQDPSYYTGTYNVGYDVALTNNQDNVSVTENANSNIVNFEM